MPEKENYVYNIIMKYMTINNINIYPIYLSIYCNDNKIIGKCPSLGLFWTTQYSYQHNLVLLAFSVLLSSFS